jgi:hypothetical protein
MTIGASNASGERLGLFQRAMVPQSNNITEGCVVVHVLVSGDNLAVDIPTAAAAFLGGRAFAGIVTNQGTVNTVYDNQVTVQKAGIAKCILKANTACTAGQEAGYSPADPGTVQPITPASAGVLVSIGRFTQTKTSSASAQFVGVELHVEGASAGEQVLAAIVASSTAITDTASETAFNLSAALPANRILAPGTVLWIRAKARITAATGNETMVFKARLDSTTGVIFGATPAVDVTNAGGDLAVLDLVATVRSVGAGGTLVCNGFGGISPGQGVATGGNVQTTGTAGTIAIDTTVAHTLVITLLSSGAGPFSAVLEDLVVTIFG